ncbi:ATP-binding cassette domain-containing protein [Erwinia rhapontici]|uniref:ATP-binding cassette domain-containing protein n=1 Tax=Erwinia rhapontici TaxID=55212 RepID=UPI003BA14789
MSKSAFDIIGITENNLQDIDFQTSGGELVVITGVSGSGKSTLVNNVIAAEAVRQSRIRRKSDDLFDYCIRPDIRSVSQMPEPAVISQRAINATSSSTFGTRTGLNDLLISLYIRKGEIIYNGQKLLRPNWITIAQFRQTYFPQASLLGRITQFDNISGNKVASLHQSNVKHVLLRAQGKTTFRQLSINKLSSTPLTGYETFIDLDQMVDAEKVLAATQAAPLLIQGEKEINLNEHALAVEDGTIFRLPSRLLFSRSTQSSLSGCCRKCTGSGNNTRYDIERAINPHIALKEKFLTVPLSAAGRYKGFKFLPSGLSKLLKKSGIDINQTWYNILPNEQYVVLKILADKLSNNADDPVSQQFITTVPCDKCQGSGLDWQARAVTINGHSIDYFFQLSPEQILAELPPADDEILVKIRNILYYLNSLSLEHISLVRPTTMLSSGERQRLKLLPVLANEYTGRVIILDEPSSNLQYRDNLKLLTLAQEMKARDNTVIIIDHNPVYQMVADRCLVIGPGPGKRGGKYCPSEQFLSEKFTVLRQKSMPVSPLIWKEISLHSLRNIQLQHISLPVNSFSAIIGASGAGKSTLCRELIFPALQKSGADVILLDSSPARAGGNSILATWLNIFDKIRKFYARNGDGAFSESDFSFNSTGACPNCQGAGYVENNLCGVCLGSRFRADVALVRAGEKTLPELLRTDIDDLLHDGDFAFLKDIVQILQRLSLSHLSLGRETNSLSGGELQRLKIARFLLDCRSSEHEDKYVILDEPCQGLDPKAAINLYETLKDLLPKSTVISIEHNPHFIYRCLYIVDLGAGSGIKNEKTVVTGLLREDKCFPSLNHDDVLSDLKSAKSTLQANTDIRKPPYSIVENDIPARKFNSKHYALIPDTFLLQQNFALEKEFSQKFHLAIPDENVSFYRSQDELFSALKNKQNFSFNPYISQLERFPIIPECIKKAIIKQLGKWIIICDSSFWEFRVKANSLQEAWLKGAGVVIVEENGKLAYHTVRLFSLLEQVVDRIYPHTFAFNLYKNSCQHCHGYGYLQSYPLNEWINSEISVLDNGVMSISLEKIVPKKTIAHLAKENLFDFSKPINALTESEKNILFYGFKSYRFRKPGSTDDTDDSFFEWRGINSYIYRNATKLSPRKDLHKFIGWVSCPFCEKGFNKKNKYYKKENKTIMEHINKIII